MERKGQSDCTSEVAVWSCQWQTLTMKGSCCGDTMYTKSCWIRHKKLLNHRRMFFSNGMPNVLSARRTRWCLAYRTMLTRCYFFMVYQYRTDLTLVGSSPSAGTAMVFVGLLLHTWPLLSNRRFPFGSPHLLTFSGCEESSGVAVVLCNNTTEVV